MREISAISFQKTDEDDGDIEIDQNRRWVISRGFWVRKDVSNHNKNRLNDTFYLFYCIIVLIFNLLSCSWSCKMLHFLPTWGRKFYQNLPVLVQRMAIHMTSASIRLPSSLISLPKSTSVCAHQQIRELHYEMVILSIIVVHRLQLVKHFFLLN